MMAKLRSGNSGRAKLMTAVTLLVAICLAMTCIGAETVTSRSSEVGSIAEVGGRKLLQSPSPSPAAEEASISPSPGTVVIPIVSEVPDGGNFSSPALINETSPTPDNVTPASPSLTIGESPSLTNGGIFSPSPSPDGSEVAADTAAGGSPSPIP